jgi:molybdenum cofactor cytidylyltransferase
MTGLVLLAAGESARMGTPKQVLSYGGRSLLRRAAQEALASGCRPVVVVLGAFAHRVGEEVPDLPLQIVTNEAWREGMAGSIRAGLEAVMAGPDGLRVGSVVIATCDQPFCTAAIIRRLVACYEERECAAVQSSYAGACGVPVLVDRRLFPELLELRGTEGARRVLQRHAEDTFMVPFPAGAIDIDTPEDYAGLGPPSA